MRTAPWRCLLPASKAKVLFILNENMVVLHSWSACCFLVTFTFSFSGSDQSDRWVGLSDRDSLQVPLFHCHHCYHNVIIIILLHISSEVFSLNLTPLLSVLEHFFVVPLPLTIPFPIISHQTFAWSDETPVTFTNWGTGMPRYDRDYDEEEVEDNDDDCVDVMSMLLSKHAGDGAACVFMDSTDGSWKHSSCSEERAAVCR